MKQVGPELETALGGSLILLPSAYVELFRAVLPGAFPVSCAWHILSRLTRARVGGRLE